MCFQARKTGSWPRGIHNAIKSRASHLVNPAERIFSVPIVTRYRASGWKQWAAV